MPAAQCCWGGCGPVWTGLQGSICGRLSPACNTCLAETSVIGSGLSHQLPDQASVVCSWLATLWSAQVGGAVQPAIDDKHCRHLRAALRLVASWRAVTGQVRLRQGAAAGAALSASLARAAGARTLSGQIGGALRAPIVAAGRCARILLHRMQLRGASGAAGCCIRAARQHNAN